MEFVFLFLYSHCCLRSVFSREQRWKHPYLTIVQPERPGGRGYTSIEGPVLEVDCGEGAVCAANGFPISVPIFPKTVLPFLGSVDHMGPLNKLLCLLSVPQLGCFLFPINLWLWISLVSRHGVSRKKKMWNQVWKLTYTGARRGPPLSWGSNYSYGTDNVPDQRFWSSKWEDIVGFWLPSGDLTKSR